MQGIMAQMSTQLTELLGPQVVQLSLALTILVVGWLVALLARVIVRGALKRTTLSKPAIMSSAVAW